MATIEVMSSRMDARLRSKILRQALISLGDILRYAAQHRRDAVSNAP